MYAWDDAEISGFQRFHAHVGKLWSGVFECLVSGFRYFYFVVYYANSLV